MSIDVDEAMFSSVQRPSAVGWGPGPGCSSVPPRGTSLRCPILRTYDWKYQVKEPTNADIETSIPVNVKYSSVITNSLIRNFSHIAK